jgi:integrase
VRYWWRESKSCYYTTIDGKQKPLAKTLKQSKTKLQRLLTGSIPGPDDPGISFAKLADQFLEHSQAENEKETFDVHRLFLQSFVDFVGKQRRINALCAADLDKWCRKQTTWCENTCVRAKAIVLAALNYGLKKLNLPSHPLRHVRPGTCGSRDRYLTAEERQKIRDAVKGPFADYLFALEQTGARPFSEVAKVTAQDADLQGGTWTLAKWKNSRKQKGNKRVIYLTDSMIDLTRRCRVTAKRSAWRRKTAGGCWTRPMARV